MTADRKGELARWRRSIIALGTMLALFAAAAAGDDTPKHGTGSPAPGATTTLRVAPGLGNVTFQADESVRSKPAGQQADSQEPGGRAEAGWTRYFESIPLFKGLHIGGCTPAPRSAASSPWGAPPSSSWPARGEAAVTACWP